MQSINQTGQLFESDNLYFREFITNDAPFIVGLLNTPGWLKFIGDRNVHSTEDAVNYLLTGPFLSYLNNGFGGWAIIEKTNGQPIGMCGLFKRDYLDHPDLGFALMPSFEGKGYAYESSRATLQYVQDKYALNQLYATTTPDNVRSQALLTRLGFTGRGQLTVPCENLVLNLYHVALQ